MLVTVAGSPRKFGRLVEHDPRSRAFRVSVRPDERPVTVHWQVAGEVLDQGELGSCTGNAMAHWENLTRAAENPEKADFLNQEHAIELYSRATVLDEFPGEYPPEDTGSSGLAVSKAAKDLGYISEYRHGFGLHDALVSLKTAPVLIGTAWYSGMLQADKQKDFVLDVSGDSMGGHEYLMIGCDVDDETVTILNSWSGAWGLNGTAKISFDDMRKLLEDQGDVVMPVQ